MSPLRILVSEVEFVETVLSALPWHSRVTVIKDAHLLPSGPPGIHVALRESRPLRGHPSPHPAQIPWFVVFFKGIEAFIFFGELKEVQI